jgi:hypothetical protein
LDCAAPITSCVGEVVKLTALRSDVDGLVCCVQATTAVVPVRPSDGIAIFALKSVDTFVQVVSAPAPGTPTATAVTTAARAAMRIRRVMCLPPGLLDLPPTSNPRQILRTCVELPRGRR